ncbi:hypothetical protein MNBD_GAMMA10-901 [hydrothermal vent metagenome]|uniref:Uncharacterized protein n=1 Tax=hydrothermal vent metagenome TaxID=652676 RepID=A0A3B0XJM0_9ZZZZ
MFRRLNFLLPNTTLAQNVVNELTSLGINNKDIHSCASQSLPIGLLNPVTANQRMDKALTLENTLWKANLVLFFIFLAVCILALVTQQLLIALACITVMLISFAAGNFFTKHIPHTHLNEFKHALSHNEILIMADMPDERIAEVEDKIHRHHPAAIEGGSSWAIKGVDL